MKTQDKKKHGEWKQTALSETKELKRCYQPRSEFLPSHTLRQKLTAAPPPLTLTVTHINKHTDTHTDSSSCSWILVCCLFIPEEGHLLLLELVCVCTVDMGWYSAGRDTRIRVCVCLWLCVFEGEAGSVYLGCSWWGLERCWLDKWSWEGKQTKGNECRSRCEITKRTHQLPWLKINTTAVGK